MDITMTLNTTRPCLKRNVNENAGVDNDFDRTKVIHRRRVSFSARDEIQEFSNCSSDSSCSAEKTIPADTTHTTNDQPCSNTVMTASGTQQEETVSQKTRLEETFIVPGHFSNHDTDMSIVNDAELSESLQMNDRTFDVPDSANVDMSITTVGEPQFSNSGLSSGIFSKSRNMPIVMNETYVAQPEDEKDLNETVETNMSLTFDAEIVIPTKTLQDGSKTMSVESETERCEYPLNTSDYNDSLIDDACFSLSPTNRNDQLSQGTPSSIRSTPVSITVSDSICTENGNEENGSCQSMKFKRTVLVTKSPAAKSPVFGTFGILKTPKRPLPDDSFSVPEKVSKSAEEESPSSSIQYNKMKQILTAPPSNCAQMDDSNTVIVLEVDITKPSASMQQQPVSPTDTLPIPLENSRTVNTPSKWDNALQDNVNQLDATTVETVIEPVDNLSFTFDDVQHCLPTSSFTPAPCITSDSQINKCPSSENIVVSDKHFETANIGQNFSLERKFEIINSAGASSSLSSLHSHSPVSNTTNPTLHGYDLSILKTAKGLDKIAALKKLSKSLKLRSDSEFESVINEIVGFVHPAFIQGELKMRECEKLMRRTDFPTELLDPALIFSRRIMNQLRSEK